MTFTSYAQNFEDVILWRALKHVQHGRYIDVGAQDPIVDSVSRGFYEQGWRGIHVEPVAAYAEALRRDRPDEEVLQLALAEDAGIMTLNVIRGTGLSTGVEEYAKEHLARHGFASEAVAVPKLPIRTALPHLAGTEVHWLKIDVEGFEEKVLRGWDSKILRPWIIVVEATIPMSGEVRSDGVDRILRESGYDFEYFDGLNKFYVASEHPELALALKAPPNVFDDFVLSGLSTVSSKSRDEIEQLQEQLRASQRELEALRISGISLKKWAEDRAASAESRVALAEVSAASAAAGAEAARRLADDRQKAAAVEADCARRSAESLAASAAAEVEVARRLAAAAASDAQIAVARAEARADQAERQFARVETASAKLSEVAARVRSLEQELAAAHETASQRQQELEAACETLRALRSSTSWRVSAPVRWIGTPVHRLRSAIQEGRIKSGLKWRLKYLLRTCAVTVGRRPHPALGASNMLRHSPVSDQGIHGLLDLLSHSAKPPASEPSDLNLKYPRFAPFQLTDDARMILTQLYAATRPGTLERLR